MTAVRAWRGSVRLGSGRWRQRMPCPIASPARLEGQMAGVSPQKRPANTLPERPACSLIGDPVEMPRISRGRGFLPPAGLRRLQFSGPWYTLVVELCGRGIRTMGAVESKIPSLITGADIYSLPLDSKEGFVLSVVDGAACVEEISFICGIEMEETLRILERLVEFGVVRWSGSKVITSRRRVGPSRGRENRGPAVSGAPERGGAPDRETSGAGQSARRPARDRAERVPDQSAESDTSHDASHMPLGSGDGESLGSGDGESLGSEGREGRSVVVQSGLLAAVEPEEDVELDDDRRRQILEAFSRLDCQDLYEVLEVRRDADKKEIRAAYFERSKLFHPDSVFGMRIGSYKSKMEAVFNKLTEAYDVLGKKKKRKEYDEYLAAGAHTDRTQEALARGQSAAQKLEQEVLWAEQSDQSDQAIPTVSWPSSAPDAARDSGVQIVSEASSETSSETSSSASSPSPSTDGVGDSGVRTASQTPSRFSSQQFNKPSLTPEERRAHVGKMLRKKLDSGRSLIPSGRPSGNPAAGSFPPDADMPTSDIERRSEVVLGLGRSLKAASDATGVGTRISQYMKQATESEREGDMVAAANALRLALSVAPERQDIKGDYERVSTVVAAKLADQYEKRASYEERAGKWGDAAISWAKVSDGRPQDANAARRVAEALLRAGGDLHRAQKYALAAVELAPKDVTSLVVLARVYLAGGLKLNATRELEKALKLDPKNQMVKNLLKEAR